MAKEDTSGRKQVSETSQVTDTTKPAVGNPHIWQKSFWQKAPVVSRLVGQLYREQNQRSPNENSSTNSPQQQETRGL